MRSDLTSQFAKPYLIENIFSYETTECVADLD